MIFYNACDTIDKRVRFPFKETVTPFLARRILAEYYIKNKGANFNEIIYTLDYGFVKKEYSIENLNYISCQKTSI